MIKIYEDFLPQELAENIHKEIYKTPENWWSTVYKQGSNNPKYFRNTLENKNSKQELDKKLSLQGDFSYRFTRSTNHVKNCDCYECKFNTYLEGAFTEWVINNTYLQNPKRFESFVSVYDKGDYLSTHTDNKRGIAFVFNFTKNWKPEYGGMLHVAGKYYCPIFNSLTIIDLSDGGIPHFVSEVSNLAPHQRVSITGWFNES